MYIPNIITIDKFLQNMSYIAYILTTKDYHKVLPKRLHCLNKILPKTLKHYPNHYISIYCLETTQIITLTNHPNHYTSIYFL